MYLISLIKNKNPSLHYSYMKAKNDVHVEFNLVATGKHPTWKIEKKDLQQSQRKLLRS